jgi:hypothetical protein
MTTQQQIEQRARKIYDISKKPSRPKWEHCPESVKEQSRKIATHTLLNELRARVDQMKCFGDFTQTPLVQGVISQLEAEIRRIEDGQE